MMKQFKRVLLIILPAILPLIIIFILLIAIIGFVVGKSVAEEQVNNMRANAPVINSQLYASYYKNLLNSHLLNDGYVSLERLVFYLQHTKNVLDTSSLSYEEWEQAYFDNINSNEKQMIPIKTICRNLKNDITLPTFTIESGTNDDGIQIDVIDLCYENDENIVDNNDYNENYLLLPYTFPIRTNFTITSFVFEHRNVELDLSKEEQEKINYHSGWDISVPIGTNFYSICDGIF